MYSSLLLASGLVVAWAAMDPIGQTVSTFPLSAVNLTGGVHKDAQDLNAQYLLSLDVDRLLYSFRVTGGLNPTVNASTTPYGGWEDPTCELRGHFVGHYLSAIAFSASSTKNPEFIRRAEYLVDVLATIQQIDLPTCPVGYVSAFPTTLLDTLEALKYVWAPYYTLHKILAGLLDIHDQIGNQKALDVAVGMANYLHTRIRGVVASMGYAHWAQCLETEFGGMNELAYNLYFRTGNPDFQDLAALFYKAAIWDKLAAHQDGLNNFHANTHIPQLIGLQRGWEATSNATLKDIPEFFYDLVVANYSYATLGSNVGEFWHYPNEQGTAIATTYSPDGHPVDSPGFHTQESCTQYNMLKVTRTLFIWQPSVPMADAYERRMMNGVLGIQKPNQVGVMIYMNPVGAGVSKSMANFNQGWGTPEGVFWCCYGTAIESFSKLGDSVFYFNGATDLWVVLFVNADVNWQVAGMSVRQTTSFSPDSTYQSVNLTIDRPTANPTASSIHLRVPGWAVGARSTVVIQPASGSTIEVPITPGEFAVLSRVWADGDRVIAQFGLEPRLEFLRDWRPGYRNTAAIIYGPLMLVGLSSTADFELDVNPDKVAQSFAITGPMRFQVSGLRKQYNLMPYFAVSDEFYTVYFNFTG